MGIVPGMPDHGSPKTETRTRANPGGCKANLFQNKWNGTASQELIDILRAAIQMPLHTHFHLVEKEETGWQKKPDWDAGLIDLQPFYLM